MCECIAISLYVWIYVCVATWLFLVAMVTWWAWRQRWQVGVGHSGGAELRLTVTEENKTAGYQGLT